MVAVVEHVRKTQPNSDHVGIVYNFHHGHADIGDFDSRFRLMKPYLLCLNLNGMSDAKFVNEKTLENKILTIGSGANEKRMIEIVLKAGYEGPIGVIDHLNELDSEIALQDNIKGLEKLVTETVTGEQAVD